MLQPYGLTMPRPVMTTSGFDTCVPSSALHPAPARLGSGSQVVAMVPRAGSPHTARRDDDTMTVRDLPSTSAPPRAGVGGTSAQCDDRGSMVLVERVGGGHRGDALGLLGWTALHLPPASVSRRATRRLDPALVGTDLDLPGRLQGHVDQRRCPLPKPCSRSVSTNEGSRMRQLVLERTFPGARFRNNPRRSGCRCSIGASWTRHTPHDERSRTPGVGCHLA